MESFEKTDLSVYFTVFCDMKSLPAILLICASKPPGCVREAERLRPNVYEMVQLSGFTPKYSIMCKFI